MRKVSDSVLLPEDMALEPISTQKDDIRVVSQQSRKNRLPGRGRRQRMQVRRGWQAAEEGTSAGSECYRDMDSRMRESIHLTKQTRQRGSEVAPRLGQFSAKELCLRTPPIVWSYALMPLTLLYS